ncbi:MAG: RcpC/CpaB family pilus assembly protein [Propionibacteriaceae bacterium]|nr:RcpC/CpaB family pilus assembly protein [Propionibacteriaceae bacterium]
MKRRMIAAIIAVVLMVIGALLLLRYVATVDERAQAQLEPVEVLVVTKPIARGQKPAFNENVEAKKIARVAIVPGAVQDFQSVSDKVAAVDMIPGEQLLPERFLDRAALGAPEVKIPEGMVQVTVPLGPERILGGYVKPDDKVTIVVTTEAGTKSVLHNVLITRVQMPGEDKGKEEGEDAEKKPKRPSGTSGALLTFALNLSDAERVVWSAENASMWLLAETEKSVTTNGNTNPVTGEVIFK